MNERVLLVDDDEDLRILLCEGLQGRGMDVESVASGQACLARLDQFGFDVVVTDVQMPGMTGIELCRELTRRIPPLATIVMTSLRDHTTMPAALASGAVEFLLKPITVAALEAAIRRALGAARRGESPAPTLSVG